MEIIPAILPKNFVEIEDKVSLVSEITDLVQIDICDGKFVPTITWPYWKADIKPDENFSAILREDRGMPEWENIDYEFDLMISEPTPEVARKWLSAGAKRIVLHHESSKDLSEVIHVLNGLVEIGLAINNTTDISEIKKYEDKIQYIQIMGIRKAGFQAQPFEMVTLDKIKEVKATFPNMKIQIDGGVNSDNIFKIKEAGADSVVTGSALFESDNIFETFEEFKSI